MMPEPNRLVKINYEGPIYGPEGHAFHDLLTKHDQLLTTRFGYNRLIVAAPHHTPKGVENLPCGRWGDENAGYLARNVADHLGATMVVAANANYDPNKAAGDYESLTVCCDPQVFVETHGFGYGYGKPMTQNDIEISCGTPEFNAQAMHLAERMRFYLAKVSKRIASNDPQTAEELISLKVEGDYGNIYFKAKQTRSLSKARLKGILPYHIEHNSAIRKNGPRSERGLPVLGEYVTAALAASIAEIHQDVVLSTSKTIDELIRS